MNTHAFVVHAAEDSNSSPWFLGYKVKFTHSFSNNGVDAYTSCVSTSRYRNITWEYGPLAKNICFDTPGGRLATDITLFLL
jgi:hypothetical protein